MPDKKPKKRTTKKLDMGKSCIRFKKLEDLPLDLVGETIAGMSAKDYIARYEANLSSRKPMKREDIKKMVAKREAGKKAMKKVAGETAKRTKRT